MSRDAWYRNTHWSPDIEAHFRQRLARSRSQRDQYLVIQAIYLSRSHPEVALRLIDQYFDTRTGTFDEGRALTARAAAQEALGFFDDAVATYFRVLDLERARPSQQSDTRFALPYLVATRGLSQWYQEMLELPSNFDMSTPFPVNLFRLNAALAIILDSTGFASRARDFARKGLGFASITTNQIGHHSNLGLVGSRNENTLKRLRAISDNEPQQAG